MKLCWQLLPNMNGYSLCHNTSFSLWPIFPSEHIRPIYQAVGLISDVFEVIGRMRLGYVLAPLIFTLFLAAVTLVSVYPDPRPLAGGKLTWLQGMKHSSIQQFVSVLGFEGIVCSWTDSITPRIGLTLRPTRLQLRALNFKGSQLTNF